MVLSEALRDDVRLNPIFAINVPTIEDWKEEKISQSNIVVLWRTDIKSCSFEDVHPMLYYWNASVCGTTPVFTGFYIGIYSLCPKLLLHLFEVILWLSEVYPKHSSSYSEIHLQTPVCRTFPEGSCQEWGRFLRQRISFDDTQSSWLRRHMDL